MQKIMFNDKYGLTKAVLEGRKTMTRRVAKAWTRSDGTLSGWMPSKYKVGEVVAVAQSYESVLKERGGVKTIAVEVSAGFRNKMFVVAEYMPHQIRITNVRVERLQDISDEDCLREGIYETKHHSFGYPPSERQRTFQTAVYERFDAFSTPRHAFAALIDKVSGKGTWGRNPWVFAYEFELVK